MSGFVLVQASAYCPYCDVKKNQIDGTEERALRVVRDAIDAHVREVHPDKPTRVFPTGVDQP